MIGHPQKEWVMMRTIFSILLLVLPFNLPASSVYFSYVIEANADDIADLNANHKAIRIIRDNAYLHFASEIIDRECWGRYIENRKIDFSIKNQRMSLKNIYNNKYSYELSFDPEDISFKNLSKHDLVDFCEL